MNTNADKQSYQLHNAIFAGAAGSFAASTFFVCVWFFLLGTDYGHPQFIADTVNEMTAYAVFFLLIFASYFIAALIVYYFRERLQNHLSAWLATSILGSTLFTMGLLALLNSSFHSVGEIMKTSVFNVITLSIVAGIFSMTCELIKGWLDERQ